MENLLTHCQIYMGEDYFTFGAKSCSKKVKTFMKAHSIAKFWLVVKTKSFIIIIWKVIWIFNLRFKKLIWVYNLIDVSDLYMIQPENKTMLLIIYQSRDSCLVYFTRFTTVHKNNFATSTVYVVFRYVLELICWLSSKGVKIIFIYVLLKSNK